MNTEKRSKGKRSKSASKEWHQYRYAMAQIVFSDKPLKNPFTSKELVYGIGISDITKDGISRLSLTIMKTVDQLALSCPTKGL